MTEKTDRTGCRSKGITTKFYIKSELFSRKTEETSRTDRPKEISAEKDTVSSQPTTRIGRIGCRKVKSIKESEIKIGNEHVGKE